MPVVPASAPSMRSLPENPERKSVKELITFWNDVLDDPKPAANGTAFTRPVAGRNTVLRAPVAPPASSDSATPKVTDAMEDAKAQKALALVKGTTPATTAKVTLSEELAAFARDRAAARLARSVNSPSTTSSVQPALAPSPSAAEIAVGTEKEVGTPAQTSAPLQGWQGLKDAIVGKQGLIAGFKSVAAGRTAEGFSNIVRSIVTAPIKAVAMILDGPRKLGDLASIKGKQLVTAGENQGGIIGGLKSFAGGLIQVLGAATRLIKPAIGVCLLIFGGPAGLIAGLILLGLFAFKEAGAIINDKIDETQTLQAVREVVSGVGAMVGATVSPLASFIKKKIDARRDAATASKAEAAAAAEATAEEEMALAKELARNELLESTPGIEFEREFKSAPAIELEEEFDSAPAVELAERPVTV